MAQALSCPNGHRVPFTDDDRGAEVYCPVCGVVCAVPPQETLTDVGPGGLRCPNGHEVPCNDANVDGVTYCPVCGVACEMPGAPATAPVPVSRRRPSIFSREGEEKVAEQVAGQTPCPRCGEVIRYTVSQYGDTAYCPRCSAAITLGETLERAGSEILPGGPEQRIPQRRSLVSARVVVAALVVIAAGAGTFVYVSREHPNWLPFDAGVLPWNTPPEGGPILLPGTGPPARNKQPIEAKKESEPEPEKPRPDKEITLARIEDLPRRPDVRNALYDAQVWRDTLIDCDVPPAERRRARLDEIIPLLQEKLAPKPSPPPAYVAEFRSRFQEMRDAIAKEDLPAARRASAAAEALLAAHPQELAPHSSGYLALKARLARWERLTEGAERIAKLLSEARTQAAQGKVTEALENEARAKFLALRTPLSNAEKDRLERAAVELTPALLLARGKRAVEDAERCKKDGDAQALDQLVLEAKKVLPGLRDGGVPTLMTRLDKAAGGGAAQQSGSAFGKEIVSRFHYEKLMTALAEGDARGFVEAATKAIPGASETQRRRVTDLLFEVLEPAVMDVCDLSDQSPDLPPRLAGLRTALDAASPWSADGRWKKLDGAVRQRGERVARLALDRALKLASADRFQEAIATASPAQTLGSHELVGQARELVKKWQAELDARASQAAKDEHWKQVMQFRSEGKSLEAWAELRRFAGRYPKAPAKEVGALESELSAKVEKQADALFRQFDAAVLAKDWKAVRRQGESLLAVPLPERFGSRQKQVREKVEGLQRQAEGRFADLKRRYGKMFDAAQVIGLLKGLPQVLEMNPQHADAAALLQEAQAQGREFATRLVKVVDLMTPPPGQHIAESFRERYQERLRELILLDPDGPNGARARELLKQVR